MTPLEGEQKPSASTVAASLAAAPGSTSTTASTALDADKEVRQWLDGVLTKWLDGVPTKASALESQATKHH